MSTNYNTFPPPFFYRYTLAKFQRMCMRTCLSHCLNHSVSSMIFVTIFFLNYSCKNSMSYPIRLHFSWKFAKNLFEMRALVLSCLSLNTEIPPPPSIFSISDMKPTSPVCSGIMMDPVNGKSRGYGFLIYTDKTHAQEAAKKVCFLHGYTNQQCTQFVATKKRIGKTVTL